MLGSASFISPPKLKARTLIHKRIANVVDLQNIYALGDVIGKGNFGTVIKAKHRETKIYWAIKFINKLQAGASRIMLVEREIHILKLVNHPHIIFLDCVFESPKTIYLVFELCIRSLAKTLKSKKLFGESETVNIIKNLSCALAYLHKNDIVHRDVKLENILITENPMDPDDQLYIKVTDFGLSTLMNGTGYSNMLHDFCGTLTYMAPEMVSTKSYSHLCDVWSMGVIMYILLFGKFPFFSGNDQHLCKLISTVEIDYSALSCSPEAKHLLSKLLEKNPAFRITADEVNHHPWISGSEDESYPEASNVLQMMRMWREEMLDIPQDDGWVISGSLEATEISSLHPNNIVSPQCPNVIGISTEDSQQSFQPQDDVQCSNECEINPTVCPAAESESIPIRCPNKPQRRRSSRLPDYRYVCAKVDSNLGNLRKGASKKRTSAKSHQSSNNNEHSPNSGCMPP